jgi:hypothetical protein
MINRWLGLGSCILMLSVNGALIMRDLAPGWRVGNPPPALMPQLEEDGDRYVQFGIFDASNRRIGSSWVQYSRTITLAMIRNWTLLESLALPSVTTTPVLVEMQARYLTGERVDELEIHVRGLGVTVSFQGEFVPPNDFPCRWVFGDQEGALIIPADATRSFGSILQPFGSLPELHAGQTWKHELINPLAGMLPGWAMGDLAARFTIVSVKGVERYEHDGRSVLAHVIESDMSRAWVSPLGDVLRQEVSVPLLGQLTILLETYDEDARREAMRVVGG